MKHKLMVLAASALLAVTAAHAQPAGPGGGYGPGGWGMGPGMMGKWGMGPGMMGGWGYGYDPAGGLANITGLTQQQRDQIAQVQVAFRDKQRTLMQSMHNIMWNQAGDEAAARKNYEDFTTLQKQMFENQLAFRRQVDAILTPEQRRQLGRDRRTAEEPKPAEAR